MHEIFFPNAVTRTIFPLVLGDVRLSIRLVLVRQSIAILELQFGGCRRIDLKSVLLRGLFDRISKPHVLSDNTLVDFLVDGPLVHFLDNMQCELTIIKYNTCTDWAWMRAKKNVA